MSVLDTFFIMFESDTKKLDDGLNDADKKTKKLEHSLNSADKASSLLGGSFSGMAAAAGGALAAMLGVRAMAGSIRDSIDYADKLNDLSDAMGIATDDLDSWGKAVKMSGGTAEGFQATIGAMSADFATIATKGTSRLLPFFDELGIKVKGADGKMREVMDVLPELADKMAGLSKSESMGMGKKLGLDEGTIMLLQKGRREVEAQIAAQKAAGVVTKDQAEKAGELNDSIDQLGMNFRGLALDVGIALLPAFKWITAALGSVVTFFKEHSDFIKGLFIALGAAIMVFLVPPMLSAAATAIIAMAPFLEMAAVIAVVAGVFALLYDDVMNFKAGNESVIGSIVEKFPIVGDIIEAVSTHFKNLKDLVMAVFGLIVDIVKAAGRAFGVLGDVVGGAVDGLANKFPRVTAALNVLKDAVVVIGNFIKNFFSSIFNNIEGFITGLTSKINTMRKWLGGGDAAATPATGAMKTVKQAQEVATKANAHPLNAVSSSAISNSANVKKTSNVTVGKVEIKTQATDAPAIARAVGGQITAQLKRATANHDDGVLA